MFSLDCTGAIPVDTHVWDIAIRDYAPALAQAKSLTPLVYTSVGDIFRGRFGPHAGWAHSVLFAAELPQFRALLPEDQQVATPLLSFPITSVRYHLPPPSTLSHANAHVHTLSQREMLEFSASKRREKEALQKEKKRLREQAQAAGEAIARSLVSDLEATAAAAATTPEQKKEKKARRSTAKKS